MITYCTNIHSSESFDEVFSNLRLYLPAVKASVSPLAPFPIGLRLSHRAAEELTPEQSHMFEQWCERNGYFVPTINGFSYGDFTFGPVKERVYLPDWRSPERSSYTKSLARLLDAWLPSGQKGSISTVALGFKKQIQPEDRSAIERNLIDALSYLRRLRERSGKEILLCLEPEPGCLIETVEETVSFFQSARIPTDLRPLLGICLDCCHHAVEFEDPSACLALLQRASVSIGKVQVSSAVRLTHFESEALERLCEPRYLHQVVIRKRDGTLIRYDDLPQALLYEEGVAGEEWRIHFHVPVFLEKAGHWGTTRSFLETILPLLKGPLLEVETYTWSLLPSELQEQGVTASIIRELQWVRSRIDEKNRCS